MKFLYFSKIKKKALSDTLQSFYQELESLVTVTGIFNARFWAEASEKNAEKTKNSKDLKVMGRYLGEGKILSFSNWYDHLSR